MKKIIVAIILLLFICSPAMALDFTGYDFNDTDNKATEFFGATVAIISVVNVTAKGNGWGKTPVVVASLIPTAFASHGDEYAGVAIGAVLGWFVSDVIYDELFVTVDKDKTVAGITWSW